MTKAPSQAGTDIRIWINKAEQEQNIGRQSITVGVPQGSVLKLLLVLLYINNLPSSIPSDEAGLLAHGLSIVEVPREKCFRNGLMQWCVRQNSGCKATDYA
ncbi:hypothetical protein Trydic_g20073 [Trypoxylus dichotomus]